MAAIEQIDRADLAKRIDAVIEEFLRQYGRLPSKVRVIAKSDTQQERWEQPPTLGDAVEVTAGSRIVANEIAAKLWRESPHLTFQECVAKVFSEHPSLYESEVAASEHVSKATYDGRPVT
jgi:hypothetical protein